MLCWALLYNTGYFNIDKDEQRDFETKLRSCIMNFSKNCRQIEENIKKIAQNIKIRY